jgi:transcriptional regulator with XRE-family HTH domain
MPKPSENHCDCDIKLSFATALSNWRREKQVPLKQIAHDLGLSIATISAWENARQFPSGDNFELLVSYTGLPPCRLFCMMSDECRPPICLLMAPK